MSKQVTVALVICALAGGAFANPMPVPDTTTTLIIFGALAAGVITFMLVDAFGSEEETVVAAPERLDFSTEPSPDATPLTDDTIRREPLVGTSVANLSEELVWAALAEQGWERPGRKPFATRDSEYGNEELVVILTNGEPPAIESIRYICEGGSEELIEARYQELVVMYEGSEVASSIEYFPLGEGGPRIELEISY